MLTLIKILGLVVPLLICVAFFTVAERKIIGAIQRRRGPNVLGVFGLFQAFADGLKLFLKESILPSSASKTLFCLPQYLLFFWHSQVGLLSLFL
jgi:NADH-quinone oxidoreductase subunit H